MKLNTRKFIGILSGSLLVYFVVKDMTHATTTSPWAIAATVCALVFLAATVSGEKQ